MDTRRLILFVIFSFSIMMLWDAWQQKNAPITPVHQQTQASSASTVAGATEGGAGATTANNMADNGAFKLENGQRIKVTTDLFQAEIDTVGGDLRRLVLNKHGAAEVKKSSFVLMDDAAKPMLYIAQTGLMGADLPNHKSTFSSSAASYSLADGATSQEVRLSWAGNNGINVDKVYTFKRGSYVVDVSYQINNGSASAITPSAYYQIVHDSESNQKRINLKRLISQTWLKSHFLKRPKMVGRVLYNITLRVLGFLLRV